MATTIIRITGDDPSELLAVEASNPKGAMARLASYIHSLASGVRSASVACSYGADGEVRASGTVIAAAVAGADTVTINGTALTATQHHARGTATFSSADAGDNITIGATTFVGTAGAVVLGAATYSVDTGNTEAATSLAAQINAHAVASTVVTASSSAAVVTIRAIAAGTGGNSIVLTSTDGTDLAVSGAGTLTGGAAVANNQFDFGGTNAQTATALAAAINASTTDAINDFVTASVNSATVTVTAIAYGDEGNTITLASSNGTRLAVSAARLAGGTDATFVTYNLGA